MVITREYPEPREGLACSLDWFIGPLVTRAEMLLIFGLTLVTGIVLLRHVIW